VPSYFFQIWINDENAIPELIRNNFENIARENPDFECKIYDKNDCIQFLEHHFDEDVRDAYKKIIPGAFKADLMRYCILYEKGGIYLDAKMRPINGFKLVDVTDKEYFVRDFNNTGGGIWNGFMVCKPGNNKLLNAIKEIVRNVNEKYYGESSLEPTGPLLLKKMFTEDEIKKLEFDFTIDPNSPDLSKAILIVSREPDNYEKAILIKDETLVTEQSKHRNEKNYGDLWSEQNIYKYESFQNYYSKD
jgi:mannosyltransferase OCH1-like enzyme